jgi:hypothetical protein
MRRGYYAIITTFVFVVLLIAVVLVGLSLQGRVFQSQRDSDDLALGYTIAREGINTYLSCHGGTLKKDILDAGTCPLPTLVSGIRVTQYGVPPCSDLSWTLGVDDRQSLVSYAPIVHANGTVCMGKIIISPMRRTA